MTPRSTDPRVTLCKSCRAEIIYLPTAAGKQMPVNAASVYPADTTFDRAKHITHFSSCPEAFRHRRKL